MIIHSQCARAKSSFRIFVLVSCHDSIILINFNRKVIFYMYIQYSNTFGLLKYINDGIFKKLNVAFLLLCGVVLIFQLLLAGNKGKKQTPHRALGQIHRMTTERKMSTIK